MPRDGDGADEGGKAGEVMREFAAELIPGPDFDRITRDVLACAIAHERGVRLIGNVQAGEIAQLVCAFVSMETELGHARKLVAQALATAGVLCNSADESEWEQAELALCEAVEAFRSATAPAADSLGAPSRPE